MVKPGVKTTELWLTVATEIGVVAAALAGNLSPKWAAVASAVSAVGYAVPITRKPSAH